jgi:phosphohistidine phosphatase SixA
MHSDLDRWRMHSDLDRARQSWEHVNEALRQLESQRPEMPDVMPQYEAELHLARLRAFIARGRVMALERSGHAHTACEEMPASHCWSAVTGKT